MVLCGHEGKVVEVKVAGVEGCGGSTRGAALGRICKVGCSILGASFSIFAIVLAKLAFSFALLSLLAFALGCIGLFGIVPGPIIPGSVLPFILPLSFCLPGIGAVIGEMRSAFLPLEKASASGSFSAFSFAFAPAFESTLHFSSLETSLKPRVVVLVVDPEGVLICFKETFRAILFILDPIALLVVQVALVNHQKSLSATVARGSEERIINGSLCGAKDLEVNLTKLVQAVICQNTVPMCHQGSQHLSLILCEVRQGHKDEGNKICRDRNGPCMLVSEPFVGPFHRLVVRDGCLFFCWKTCNESSDLCVHRVRDRQVGVVPRFLHPLN